MGSSLELSPVEIHRSDLLKEGITKSLVKQAYNEGVLSTELCCLAIACIFFPKEEDNICCTSFSIAKLRNKMIEKLGPDIGNSLDVHSEKFQIMAEKYFIVFNPTAKIYRCYTRSDNSDQHYILSQKGAKYIRSILRRCNTGKFFGIIQSMKQRIWDLLDDTTSYFRR